MDRVTFQPAQPVTHAPYLRLSRAYGVNPSPQGETSAAVIARATTTHDVVELSSPVRTASQARAAISDRLVAARVEVPADPALASTPAETPASALPGTSLFRTQSGAYQMYRHPADRNTAATTVSAGRMVDIEA